MRAASITVDLDTSRFYREIHGLEQSTPAGVVDSIYTLGVRRLLDRVLGAELGKGPRPHRTYQPHCSPGNPFR